MVSPTDRSQFVTVVAWVFIVLSSISFVSGSGVVVRSLATDYDTPESESALADYSMGSFLSWALPATPQRVLAFYAAWTLVSGIILITSIGLVRRRVWARRAFIFWMGVAALVMALATVNSIWFLFAVDWIATPGGKFLLYSQQIVGIIFRMGLAVTFIWIIRQLQKPDVLAEFQ